MNEVSCQRDLCLIKQILKDSYENKVTMAAALELYFLKVIRSWGQLSIKCLAIKPCHQQIEERLPFCFLSSEQALGESGVQVNPRFQNGQVTWQRPLSELVAKSGLEARCPHSWMTAFCDKQCPPRQLGCHH